MGKHLSRSAKLELRQQQQLKRQRADEALRDSKKRRIDPREEILAGLEGTARGPMSQQLICLRRDTFNKGLTRDRVTAARRVLLAAAEKSRLLSDAGWQNWLHKLVGLARYQQFWIRDPESWRPHTHNVYRQFAAFTRHLLANFDVPACFNEAWDMGPGHRFQSWFIHIGQGGNLRKAEGLPIPLTKLMAHHALLAPEGCSIRQALRWGQARGTGLEMRLAQAVVASRIGNSFESADREAFWLSVLQWIAQYPMLDPNQVGPIIDYLHHQKFVSAGAVNVNGTFVRQAPPQPGLSMHKRCPAALVAHVAVWHRQLARGRDRRNLIWPTCGIAGYSRVEGDTGNQRHFEVRELLTSAQLLSEGRAMHHCVGTYADSCNLGRTAIYSMTVTDRDGERRLSTIEVDLRNRQIVQVRGRYNAPATAMDARILRAWMTTSKLSLGSYCQGIA